MGQLRLTVPTARHRWIRPGVCPRGRNIGVAQVGGAVDEQLAHDRGHLESNVLNGPDAVRPLDQTSCYLDDPHLIPRVTQHHVQAERVREPANLPGIRGNYREGLLGEDMDSRAECRASLLSAKGRRTSQGDDVRLCLDDLVPVRGRVRESEARLQNRQPVTIAPIDDPGLDLWPAKEARDVRERGPRPGPDDARRSRRAFPPSRTSVTT